MFADKTYDRNFNKQMRLNIASWKTDLITLF